MTPFRDDPLASIARQALRGDERAIRRLLDGVAPTVLAVVRAMLGRGHPDVEDVAQDVFVAFLDALRTFRYECTLVHFARRVSVRRSTVAIRFARAGRRSAQVVPLDDQVPASGTPHDEILAQRRMGAWRLLLAELPEQQAEAIAMKVILGYSLEEIAEATEVPVNTVRSRMIAAKDSMRDRIDSDPRLAQLSEDVHE